MGHYAGLLYVAGSDGSASRHLRHAEYASDGINDFDTARETASGWRFPSGRIMLGNFMPLGLNIDNERLDDLCRRYRVATLELFGSRAKRTARPDSDVDLLVSFESPRRFYSLMCQMSVYVC